MEGSGEGVVYTGAYFFHLTLILAFLNYLPYGKHFHILTFLPTVFFTRTTPLGQLRNLNLEDEQATSFGMGKLTDLTWKDTLDIATCTECGRCSSVCPATDTGKILNPKQINIDMRHLLKNPPTPPLSKGGDMTSRSYYHDVPVSVLTPQNRHG